MRVQTKNEGSNPAIVAGQDHLDEGLKGCDVRGVMVKSHIRAGDGAVEDPGPGSR